MKVNKMTAFYVVTIISLTVALVVTVWSRTSDYAWGVSETNSVLSVVCRDNGTQDKNFDSTMREALRYALETGNSWPIDVTDLGNVVIYCGEVQP